MSQELQQHLESGSFFEAGGINSFVLDEGQGEPCVLMHGVPASSYLYRKVVPALAERGLRGIAFDLPGMGLADRPEAFDYSWSGLGGFSCQAVDALNLERFHLLVHDIGGPVGFEIAARMPERIRSLTILNTLIGVESFRKPWAMRPFEVPVLGEVWLGTMLPPMFRRLMRMQGIYQHDKVSDSELNTYVELLKRGDGGKAFLRIMRSFETTAEKEMLYRQVVRNSAYPVQVAWGKYDTALKLNSFGQAAKQFAGVDQIHELPGRHFLQEDNAPAIADLIREIAG